MSSGSTTVVEDQQSLFPRTTVRVVVEGRSFVGPIHEIIKLLQMFAIRTIKYEPMKCNQPDGDTLYVAMTDIQSNEMKD